MGPIGYGVQGVWATWAMGYRGYGEYVSQQMILLYLSRLGNRSSWPVTKPTASTCKAWWPGRMPNLDMTIAGGYGFVTARMRSEPPRNDPI